MSDDPRHPEGRPPEPDDDLVPEDDAVIGRAFAVSLRVAAAIAVAALVVWGVARLARQRPEERSIAATAPRPTVSPAVAPELPFTDVAAAAGIDFVHVNGAAGEKLLPESMGGGVAVLDYDGDGRPDLLFANGAPWSEAGRKSAPPALALYRNLGGWRFENVTGRAGLAVRHYGMGLAIGDIDGDGRPDFLLTGVGGNRLFRNLGGRFEDVTRRAGVGGDAADWSTCAVFFDYDDDGRDDLFVCNYVVWSRQIDFEVDYRLTGVGRAYGPPMNYQGTYPYLFHNRGDGTFEDVSAHAGVRVDNPATGRPMAKALGVLATDIDGDGHVDLFVANDTVANFFFHNRGDGTFAEEALTMGLAFGPNGVATGAMGVASGDYRNDGATGVFIGNFAHEMTSLYRSQGDPSLYADEAIAEGIGGPTRVALSFGVALADLDLDGRLDLVQANGHLEDEIAKVDSSQSYRQPAQVFWNAGRDAPRTFLPVPDDRLGDLARPIVGRAVAAADLDGDGDPDLVLTSVAGPPLVLRNDVAADRHHLEVETRWGAPSRSARGARLVLTAVGARQRRELHGSRGYLTDVEPRGELGLGSTTEVDSLEVTWPDGRVWRLLSPPADRALRLVRPDAGGR